VFVELFDFGPTNVRMFVVEQTQPHTSQVGGIPEKERIALHLPQDKFSVIRSQNIPFGSARESTHTFASTLRARPALIADRLTFHDVLLFATSLTLAENFDASIVKDGFGALNFRWGGGLGTMRGC